MIKYIVLIAVLFGLCYLMYMGGYMPINMKSAVMFKGSITGSGNCRATFKSCDGYMKRVLRFPADKAYRFTLDTNLTKGSLNVELLNKNKEQLLLLNENNSVGIVNASAGKCNYLVFNFDNTSGDFQLTWTINRDNNVS